MVGWGAVGGGGMKGKDALSGKESNEVRICSRDPYLEDLNRRMMSCSVAATRKYSCFRRNSLPWKN